MNTTKSHLLSRDAIALAVTAGLLSALVWAGPLDPPAGPVTSTGKTLSEVEPRTAISDANTPGDVNSLFVITRPGSYYLTGNITGVAGKHGIKIASSGVSLDLNGFELAGIPAMGAFDGVTIDLVGLGNIAVFNGSLRAWGGDGLDFRSFSAATCRLTHLVARGNAGGGIHAGLNTTISSCSVGFNTGDGIRAGATCVVTNCTAISNHLDGIRADSGCIVSGCVSRTNDDDGISCSDGCVIRDNSCSSNGFQAADGAGIHVIGAGNRIENNNCTAADRGIDVDAAGNFITRNTCSGNTTNWVVAASNKCLVVLGINAGAINGNSGGVSPGSTDPNANYSY